MIEPSPFALRTGSRPELALAAVALFLLGACGTESSSAAAESVTPETGVLTVAAVNYPLAYLAERIGAGAVEVHLPVPAGVDPAYWTPSPADIAPIQSADLILLNGAGYAAWTRTATLPRTRVVDTSLAFTEQLIERADVTTHSHGPEGPHAHAATAFTTWLDPELAILQAAAIRDALAARRPAAADAFDAAFDELRAELEALDARQAAAVAQAPELAVIFSHPVYEYLARAHAMRGASLHWEPGAEPTPEQWSELEQLAADTGARWLIWEGQPLASTAQGLQARGIESVVFAPSGNRPAACDFFSAMTAGTEALEQVYGSR